MQGRYLAKINSLNRATPPFGDQKLVSLFREIRYFEEQWLNYFDNGALLLNNIYVKFPTNNSLERLNRILKYQGFKKNLDIINYVDIIRNEVYQHELKIIEESKKPLQIKSNKLGIYDCKEDEKKYNLIIQEIKTFFNDIDYKSKENTNINENNNYNSNIIYQRKYSPSSSISNIINYLTNNT